MRLGGLGMSLLCLGACSSGDLSSSGGGTPSAGVRVRGPEDFAPRPDGGAGPDARDPGGDDAGIREDGGLPVGPSVTFEEPMDGATFPKDAVAAHTWIAELVLRVRATGVVRVEYFADDTTRIGAADAAPWEAIGRIRGEGERRIVARGLDGAGTELARDEVTVTIAPPTDAACHAMLDALGLDWAAAAATRGIADPVRVQPLIGGVRFRYVSNPDPTAMLMDCELAPRLAELAALVTPHGIDEVIHIGIYNYRCIGGGDPDSGTCTPSQHAYARAIDLHAFGLAGSSDTYSTETDWVISSGDVCDESPAPATEPDRVLHEIACTLWSEEIFQIVLTPDYNADHRNHFHVDLSAGSMFIGSTVTGVDPIVPGLGD